MQAAMLRASLQLSRSVGNGSVFNTAGRQWQRVRATDLSETKRRFANIQKPSNTDSTSAVFPGSASPTTNEPSPPGRVSPVPISSAVTPLPAPAIPTPKSNTLPSNTPLNPPLLPSENAQKSPPTSVGSVLTTSRVEGSSAIPPSSPPQKPRRMLSRILAAILLLSLTSFGAGVFYSRINDNFHDFFTEYIPFGEDAVLYFEERKLRKRFPAIAQRLQRPRDTGNKVTIPSQSGVSWKVTDSKKSSDAKHSNALQHSELKSDVAVHPAQRENPEEQSKAIEKVKNDAVTVKSLSPSKAASETAKKPLQEQLELKTVEDASNKLLVPASNPTRGSLPTEKFKAPEVNEPSRFPTEVTSIDPINIRSAQEPIVQDLVKIINDIILVVNADNADAKFSSTIGKAKDELAKVGDKIKDLKGTASKEADDRVKKSHEEFDTAAKELVRRIEKEMQEQETRWKDEYEQERQKLQETYEQRFKAEIKQVEQLNEQRLRNELLEQAVEMKRKFVAEVKDRVEEERNSRLGKLSQMSITVNELEKLTTDWNSVVDTNLKTQQLHVAVEAVRAHLEKAQTPRPFIRELAALKEIAADDPVVNAAIASINPAAYQRGIPSSAQLIDRFRRVADEVRKASLLPKEAGVASHASSYLLSKILFKKKGIASGDDVESILTRTETFLEEGNLDGAAREMNALSGWAKTLSTDWIAEVRKVLEVQQALDVVSTEARLQSLRVE